MNNRKQWVQKEERNGPLMSVENKATKHMDEESEGQVQFFTLNF